LHPDVLNLGIALLLAGLVVATVAVWWRLRGRPGRRFLFLVPLLLGLALLSAMSGQVERVLNPVASGPLPEVSAEALALHRSSTVIDLHADSLLFGRDLLERSNVGHVDVPRLLEGGTALQVFSLVTHQPWGYNEEATDPDRLDLIFLLSVSRGWPPSTWFSLHERVVYQARRLTEMAARSEGRLRLVRSRDDLEALLRARRDGEAVVGGLFALEGAPAIRPDFQADLDAYFEQGLRMVSLSHFYDTAFAGSIQGLEKGGLTPAGRALVAALERRGIVVDLSHGSDALFDDVLAMATKPVVVSHIGVEGTCDRKTAAYENVSHNASDEQIRAVAANGGVIGIGLWDTAVCGITAADTVRAIQHVIDLVGDAHVGLGSDFDGYVRAHFDASQLPVLTQALLDAGLAPDSIRRILGGNVIRVLRATLPRARGALRSAAPTRGGASA
jgi:microsomal dipeptidase-like Zn-dependent dipeptidase